MLLTKGSLRPMQSVRNNSTPSAAPRMTRWLSKSPTLKLKSVTACPEGVGQQHGGAGNDQIQTSFHVNSLIEKGLVQCTAIVPARAQHVEQQHAIRGAPDEQDQANVCSGYLTAEESYRPVPSVWNSSTPSAAPEMTRSRAAVCLRTSITNSVRISHRPVLSVWNSSTPSAAPEMTRSRPESAARHDTASLWPAST